MLLGPDDPIGFTPCRIVVNGASGAGKNTLARALATRLELPYTELDSLFHGPGWTVRESFLEDVRAIAAGDQWVCEWQYDAARPVLLERCDLMVWLDVPRLRTTWRVVRRTLRRRMRREELWNGNREGPLRRIFTDPEQIIRWAWSSHPRVAPRIEQVLRERPQLPVVRLRTATDADRWVSRVSGGGGTPGRPR
ncbi:AAA family ATPase [Marmoricola sp. URHA0025 HA25]